jgi:hypothetical protein
LYRLFKSQLQEDGVAEADIDKAFRQGFVTWFRNHVSSTSIDVFSNSYIYIFLIHFELADCFQKSDRDGT